MAVVTHHVLRDNILTANSDCSFSLWDISSGKEIFNQPFTGCDESACYLYVHEFAVYLTKHMHVSFEQRACEMPASMLISRLLQP